MDNFCGFKAFDLAIPCSTILDRITLVLPPFLLSKLFATSMYVCISCPYEYIVMLRLAKRSYVL